MLEARRYSREAKATGKFRLPSEFDGTVNKVVLYQAIRAFRNNQRQGNASTKTRSAVSGGGRKPWRQKGTGRARQGTTRASHWVGGGVIFGPQPRSYRTDMPRKVRRLARQSALNQRALEGALYVIEALEFDGPKTKHMVGLLEKLSLGGKKVLVLTDGVRSEVCLSAQNLASVMVKRYADVSPYDVLWSDALLIEEGVFGGSDQAAEPVAATSIEKTKTVKKTRAVKKKSTATKKSAGSSKKGGDDA